jgi:hypothetical protein
MRITDKPTTQLATLRRLNRAVARAKSYEELKAIVAGMLAAEDENAGSERQTDLVS